MPFSSIKEIVRAQLASKELYEQAKTYAFEYIDDLDKAVFTLMKIPLRRLKALMNRCPKAHPTQLSCWKRCTG